MPKRKVTADEIQGYMVRLGAAMFPLKLKAIQPGHFRNLPGWEAQMEYIEPLEGEATARRQIAAVVRKARNFKSSHFSGYMMDMSSGLTIAVELWRNDILENAKSGDSIDNI